MAEPDLVVISNRYRAALEARNAAAVAELTARYEQIMFNVGEALRDLTARVESARLAGTPISPAWLYQERRLIALRTSLRVQMEAYATDAYTIVRTGQIRAGVDGARAARVLMAEATKAVGLGGTFTEPPVEPVIRAIANMQAGSPLAELFRAMPSELGAALEREIVTGLARGRHPNVIAREVTRVATGPLHRSVTIARTEMLRAYRMAARDEYMQNDDVLDGWIWHAHISPTTCAACWAMHGTVHPTSEILDGHPRCRCAMIPRTKTWRELGVPRPPNESRPRITRGTAEFDRLSPATQRRILGPAKLAAYQDGRIVLEDLVGRRTDSRWGSMRHERSLAEALEAARRRVRVAS